MLEEKIEKIEGMLIQLITMVGNLNNEFQVMKADQQEMKVEIREIKADQQEMKTEIREIKADQQEMKAEIREIKVDQQEMKLEQQNIKSQLQALESRSEERHIQQVESINALKIDQDFIWEKVVKNERDIGNLKRRLS